MAPALPSGTPRPMAGDVPHAAREPAPSEFGLAGDPEASWGDFYIAEDGTVTRFILADAAAEAGAEPELEAGS